MTDAFIKLGDTDVRELIAALRSGRVSAPYSDLQLTQVVSSGLTKTVAGGLNGFASLGFTSKQIVAVLELLEKDRSEGRSTEPPIDLVTSGPEAPGISSRDTSVVVRELFAHSQKSVLVVGYASLPRPARVRGTRPAHEGTTGLAQRAGGLRQWRGRCREPGRHNGLPCARGPLGWRFRWQSAHRFCLL